MAILIVYPIVAMLGRVFAPGGVVDLKPVWETIHDGRLPRIALHTALVVGGSGVAALAIGSLFAWLNERTDARLGRLARFFPLAPFMVPTVAMSIGWIFLADERVGFLNVALRNVLSQFGVHVALGPLNVSSWAGLLFVYTLFLVPYTYLVMSAAFSNIDPSLEEASRISGAGVWGTLAKVSAPLVQSAILSSLLLTLILGTAVFSIGATIGVSARIDVMSVHIVRLVQAYPSQLGKAVVLGTFLLIGIVSLVLLQRRIAITGRQATISGKASSGRLLRLGRWRWIARTAMLAYAVAAALLPALAIGVVALQRYWNPSIRLSQLTLRNFSELFSSASLAGRGLITSVTLGLIGATTGMLMAALLITYARQREGAIAGAIAGVTKLPSTLSHLVIGIGFIAAFAGPPFQLQGTLLILLLAYLVTYMPQASIAAESAGDQIGREMVEASRISGASPGRTFRLISLPLMTPGLAAGWAMLFVVMLGDLTVSVLLSGTNNVVVGAVLLQAWESGTYPQLAALASVVTAITAVVVCLVIGVARPRFAPSG